MSYDHTALFQLVRELLETTDEEHLKRCIQRCHNGELHSPINQENLHLFRRYRNDPNKGSGEAQHLIDAAKAPFYLSEPEPIEVRWSADIKCTLSVIELPDSKFGVAHVDLEMGGSPLPGIAMYACVKGEEDKWITADEWSYAHKWFTDHGATAPDLKLLESAYEESK